eukprot:2431502-Rhodomonas_salina.3
MFVYVCFRNLGTPASAVSAYDHEYGATYRLQRVVALKSKYEPLGIMADRGDGKENHIVCRGYSTYPRSYAVATPSPVLRLGLLVPGTRTTAAR